MSYIYFYIWITYIERAEGDIVLAAPVAALSRSRQIVSPDELIAYNVAPIKFLQSDAVRYLPREEVFKMSWHTGVTVGKVKSMFVISVTRILAKSLKEQMKSSGISRRSNSLLMAIADRYTASREMGCLFRWGLIAPALVIRRTGVIFGRLLKCSLILKLMGKVF